MAKGKKRGCGAVAGAKPKPPKRAKNHHTAQDPFEASRDDGRSPSVGLLRSSKNGTTVLGVKTYVIALGVEQSGRSTLGRQRVVAPKPRSAHHAVGMRVYCSTMHMRIEESGVTQACKCASAACSYIPLMTYHCVDVT